MSSHKGGVAKWIKDIFRSVTVKLIADFFYQRIILPLVNSWLGVAIFSAITVVLIALYRWLMIPVIVYPYQLILIPLFIGIALVVTIIFFRSRNSKLSEKQTLEYLKIDWIPDLNTHTVYGPFCPSCKTGPLVIEEQSLSDEIIEVTKVIYGETRIFHYCCPDCGFGIDLQYDYGSLLKLANEHFSVVG